MKKIISLTLSAAVLFSTAVFATDAYTIKKQARKSEANGDYANAKTYYEQLAAATKGTDDKWSYIEAVNKVNAFTNELDLYTLTDNSQINYNAPLEPTSGVYFGECVNSVSETHANESMMLVYADYGQTDFMNTLNKKLQQAKSLNQVVEIALNFPYHGEQLDSIIADTDYIDQLCDVLKNYQDVKIFLRIGAEPNDWTPDAEKYKQAFCKVVNVVKTVSNGNIAYVWSVTHASSANMNDYYPGDDYVDWVGVSGYGTKYFPYGDTYDVNSATYKFGNYADPLNVVREVVNCYGDRKPIMISEGGSAYQTNKPIYETDVNWAVLNLKRFYSTVMMKYPQVKLIGYFNKKMDGESSFYDLDSCTELRQAYDYMTSMPWFIRPKHATAKCFKKLSSTINVNDKLEIYALAYTFGDSQPRVDYRIDGTWVNAALYIPYQTILDLSELSDGTHSLEVTLISEGKTKETKTYTINKISSKAVNSSNGFSDISSLGQIQQNAVKSVMDKSIINGYDDGTFRPFNTLTRAEFATMVCRAFNYTQSGKCTFSDATEHWASEYIKPCVDAGAISGVGNNKFEPDSTVLVAQASKILTVCKGLVNGDIDALDYPSAFTSVAKTSGMYANTVSASEKTLNDSLSRIDAAIIFANLLR